MLFPLYLSDLQYRETQEEICGIFKLRVFQQGINDKNEHRLTYLPLTMEEHFPPMTTCVCSWVWVCVKGRNMKMKISIMQLIYDGRYIKINVGGMT